MEEDSAKYKALLTRQESNALKGLLILLVVLGHDSVLMRATGLFPYIYSFHVYCFFILPYLYGANIGEGAWGRLLRRCLRYWLAYIVMCVICLTISACTHRTSWNGWGFLRAVVTGNQALLSEHTGFGMLWFLPAICAVLLWHALYFRLPTSARAGMVAICAGLWLWAALGGPNYHELGHVVPLALMPGLYHLLTGAAARALVMNMAKHKRAGGVLAVLSIFFIPLWIVFRGHFPYSCYYLTWLLCPIAAASVLYQARALLAKDRVLQLLGGHSYGIYLTHVFIFNALLRAFPQAAGVFWGMAMFIMTLGVSLALVMSWAKARPLMFGHAR